nr:hypothetical protein [Providencia rettgeri]
MTNIKSNSSPVSPVNNPLSAPENNNKLFSSNISSVNNVGQEAQLPSKEKVTEKEVNILCQTEDLYSNKCSLQINTIKSLLNKKYPNISLEMISNTLNAMGDETVAGLEWNYQSKNMFNSLTLFTDEEIKNSKVLYYVKELINKINSGKTDEKFKQALRLSEKAFNELPFDNIWSDDYIDNVSKRFIDKYVDPAINGKLNPLLDEKSIEELPFDALFDPLLHKGKQGLITEAKNQLKKNKEPVNKHLHLYNIFVALEQKIEIMGKLSTPINTDGETEYTDGKAENRVALNLENNAKPEDCVDGGHESTFDDNKDMPALLTKPITVNDNFTSIYNMAKEAADDRPVETKEPLVEDDNQENDQVAHKQMMNDKAQERANKKPATVFNTLFGLKDAAEKTKLDVDLIRQEALLASRPLLVRKPNTVAQAPLHSFELPKRETAFIANTYQKDKNNHWVLKEPKGQKAVTLSANGMLTRNLSDKAVYQGDREAVKTVVVDTYSHLPNTGKSVTLTERGALTRDQSKKDAYTTQEWETTWKMNTRLFTGSGFQSKFNQYGLIRGSKIPIQ